MQKSKKLRQKNLSHISSSHVPSHRPFLLFSLAAVVSVSMYIILINNSTSFHVQASRPYLFGTLETDSTKAAEEHAAGVQIAMQTIAWNSYERSDGIFDEAYMAEIKSQIKMDLTAGMKVVISPAIHYPPHWVMNLPGARYINQYNARAPFTWAGHFEEPNFIFSQSVRDRVAQFETHVMKQLASDPAIGLKNIWGVRYVNGSLGETLYPPADDQQRHPNSYWAYDTNAQGQGTDRPATIPANPFPGWKPGNTLYHDQPFSTAQVQQWYNWYLNAHIDFVNWHTRLYRDKNGINYQGYLLLQTPGFGARAFEVKASVTSYLDGSQDLNATVARAAVWHKLFPALTNRTNVVAYVSSMADGSGIPPDNVCKRGDVLVNYQTDPQVNNWSATRYITGLADKYKMMKSGENPGRDDPSQEGGAAYGLSMLQSTASQMQSCGFQSMFWAHDSDLYDNASGVTLQDYASIITQYNKTR